MIVKEYRTQEGVLIQFNNAAFAEKSESEKEELRKNVNIAVGRLIMKRAQGQ